MSKPRLLDLFCGAGGATKGYQRAGFHVVGVDLHAQPNYCGDHFVQMDALWYLDDFGSCFDVIAASPPCQAYANVTRWTGNQNDHDALIAPVRELLDEIGLPYVIENVVTPEIRSDFMLCGSHFGLPIRRHRFFETNWSGLVMGQPCQHRPDDLAFDHSQERAYADALGCDWMSAREARQAVPPAYTEHIGGLLLEHLAREVAA